MSSLHNLLNLPGTIEGKTLPQWLRDRDQPTPPPRDIVGEVLAAHRDEQKYEDKYNSFAMLEAIRRKRAIGNGTQHLNDIERQLIEETQR